MSDSHQEYTDEEINTNHGHSDRCWNGGTA